MTDSPVIEVHQGDELFSGLRVEWEDLWQQCPEATEAQSWSWQHLYRAHVARREPVFAITARCRGHLTALGVFALRRDRATLQRRLGFLGEHDVDYHGILYRKGTPEAVGRDMLTALLKAVPGATVLEILNVREESWTRRVLEQCGDFEGFTGPQQVRLSERYAIPLPATMEDYWAAFSKKTRDRLKGKMRKLQREFQVDFRSITGEEGLERVLDEVEVVERARWGAANKFGDEASRNFLRAMITALVKQERCRIFTLHLDGRCVSYIVGFVLRGALRIPYLAHDISMPGNHSVGLICNLMAIEQCIREGYREYDLTRGSEGYKSLLGGEQQHNYSVVRFRSRVYERLAGFSQRIVTPLLRHRFMRRLRELTRG